MRLPHSIFESRFFVFDFVDELLSALDGAIDAGEISAIRNLTDKGLVPVSSPVVLAAILGVNEGIIWSFLNSTAHHYRSFQIHKGRKTRTILAPRVALKVVQRWLAYHLSRAYQAPRHVYGFVPDRSHVGAASCHLRASWVNSFDIRNFFPSTPEGLVCVALGEEGYCEKSAGLIAKLSCINGFLVQGSPLSPVLSNLALSKLDDDLCKIALSFDVRLTRYADDITFSGTSGYPDGLREAVEDAFSQSPWDLATDKTSYSKLPERLSVHGLLVHGETLRLTKRKRNRVRALEHLRSQERIRDNEARSVNSFIGYHEYVEGNRGNRGQSEVFTK